MFPLSLERLQASSGEQRLPQALISSLLEAPQKHPPQEDGGGGEEFLQDAFQVTPPRVLWADALKLLRTLKKYPPEHVWSNLHASARQSWPEFAQVGSVLLPSVGHICTKLGDADPELGQSWSDPTPPCMEMTPTCFGCISRVFLEYVLPEVVSCCPRRQMCCVSCSAYRWW